MAAGSRKPARRRPLLLASLLALTLLICAGFVALGLWQLQRLAWKEALIERVHSRLQAAPQPFPPRAAWAALGSADDYRRVQLAGRWAHEHETLVQASTALGGGYWVLTPLQLADGAWVWVNRGFVPPELRDPALRPAPAQASGLVGLLRSSEPGGRTLRRNEPEAGRWYSRDVAALSRQRALEGAVAPVFVDEVADAAQPQRWPRPGLTLLQFSNSHLAYALTWFTLAAMALGAAGLLVWDDARRHVRLSDSPIRDA